MVAAVSKCEIRDQDRSKEIIMMMNPRDKELIHAKQEGRRDTAAPAASSSSSSRQWSGFKNPRIVRVSRTFGGKDRHSKVCTIRGLRDRRIRLSVPTAIQLYDLQDRLGLSQPSKVVDWLLEATKYDIDGLPPLQVPPGSVGFHRFQHHHHPSTTQLGSSTNNQHPAAALQQPSSFSPFLDANLTLMNNDGASDSLYNNSAAKDGDININHDLDINEEDEEGEEEEDDYDDRLSLEAKLEKIKYWNINRSSTEEDDHRRRRQYGGAGEHGTSSGTGGNDTNHNNGISGSTQHAAPFPQNFFPIANLNNTTSFFPMTTSGGGGGLFNNPYGYYHCDPSNLSLSQFGSINNNNNNLPISQTDHHHVVPLPCSLAPYGSPQLYFCPPPPNMTASLAFPQHSSYNINRQHDHEQIGDMRQISRFQLSSANLSPSFHTNDEHHGKPKKND